MKTKRISISIIVFILSAICGLGFISLPKRNVQSSAADELMYKQYILDEGVPTETELERSAGSLTINGEPVDLDSYTYIMGTPNIELTATANDGYLLKGWYIVFEETSKGQILGTVNGYISITDSEQIIHNDYLKVSTFENNNKKATLTILEMFDNIKVAPVFDYELYTVSLVDANGTKQVGQYKYNDEVNISETIGGGKLIDITSFVASNKDISLETQVSNHEKTGVATGYSINFDLNVFEDVEIQVKYDLLYKVDFKLYLQDEEITDSESQEYIDINSCYILKSDRVWNDSLQKYETKQRYFNKVTEGESTYYLVKQKANFEISALPTFDNNGYVYYNFEALDYLTEDGTIENKNAILNLNDIAKDTTVLVKYVHNVFKIEFVGVDYYSDKTVRVNASLDLPNAIEVTRANPTVALDDSLLKTNIGYSCAGFAEYVKNQATYSNLISSISLDVDEPQNKIVYILYTKAEYTIELTGLLGNKLEDSKGKVFYPVATLNGTTLSYTETELTGGEKVVEVTGNSFGSFEINDQVTISLTLNEGFAVSAVGNATKQGDAQVYTLTLDKEYLAAYANSENVIKLQVVSSINSYSLTYRIADITGAGDAMANISIEEYSSLTSQTNGDYLEIVVEDLKYYDVLTLTATANETEDSTPEEPQYYIFQWFTPDFKTSITTDLERDYQEQETVSLPYSISGNATVYVVFAKPQTQFKIVVDSLPDKTSLSFKVQQDSEIDVVEGLYELLQDEEVSVVISGIDAGSILFGYAFVDIKLYVNEIEEGKHIVEPFTTSSFSFTPTTSDLYIAVVKIVKINYTFKFESNISDFTINDQVLTVENNFIEFVKPTGYYVKKFEFVKSDDSKIEEPNMKQSNNTRNGLFDNGRNLFSTYYYPISTEIVEPATMSEFAKIAEYGVGTTDKVINVYLTFAIYEYDVNVKYVKFVGDNLNNASGYKLSNPLIQLSYKFTDDAEEEATVVNYLPGTDGGIVFKYIPYGVKISLEVIRGVSLGFEMKGWFDSDAKNQLTSSGLSEEEKILKYNINTVNKDISISYRVDFKQYIIELDYNKALNMGNPTINGQATTSVKMGDELNVEHNENLNNGFKFDSYEYLTPIFEEYEYDESTFASIYKDLYIKDKSYIFKNISPIYNEKITYYVMSETTTENTSGEFDNFDLGAFVEENGKVTIKVNYVPVEMKIINNTILVDTLDEKGNVVVKKLDLAAAKLDLAQVVTYTITATNAGNSRPITENDSIITIDDIVTINIQINKVTNGDGREYILYNGLNLYSLPLIANWNYEVFDASSANTGYYKFVFKVADNITREFAKAGLITIDYEYQTKAPRKLIATTNMSGAADFMSSTELQVENVVEKSTAISGGKAFAENNIGFLQTAKARLKLKLDDVGAKDFNDYFAINGVTVYLGNRQDNIIVEDWNTYFINSIAIYEVELTMLEDDLTVQFNVTPKIYLEKQEITTQQEYTFTRVYTFEIENGKIEGIAQEFSLGLDSATNDIAGYGIDPSVMEIKYYQSSNGGNVAQAVNQGDYILKLVFKNTVTDEQKQNYWLYYTDLPCVIKLKILAVNLTLKDRATQFERTYTYDNYNLVLQNVDGLLKSEDGNIILSGEVNGNTFELGYLDIANTYRSYIVSGSDGNYVSQNNVTGEYIHILITDLSLKNNTNFNIVLEEYMFNGEKCQGIVVDNIVKIIPKIVSITNIDVYNKVVDDNALAQFGLLPGKTEYVLEETFEADNGKVYLIPENLKIYFATRAIRSTDRLEDIIDKTHGDDKYIIVDARNALDGDLSMNYVVGNKQPEGIKAIKDNILTLTGVRKSIYRKTISTSIKGIGDVTLTNKRGITDYTKAGLIPNGATLSVERIEPDSAMYREIYKDISSFLSRRNVFAAGYKLMFIDKNGTYQTVSNDLYLTLPNEVDLNNVVSLSGERAVKVDYTMEGGNVLIDLNQIDEDVSYIVLIQNRALLKAWQIVLIVVVSVVGAGGVGVAIFFIVRRRRLKNEKFDTI